MQISFASQNRANLSRFKVSGKPAPCRHRVPYTRGTRIATSSTGSATELVDEVLQRIKETDRGASISAPERAKVDALLGQLEDIGREQQPQPLDNDLLYNHFSVEYVSRGANQRGEPAGGRFRRGLGKFLFTTQGLYQSVIRPDIATNKVEFKLFGMIPGYVGLRGRVDPLDKATVKVFFEPPVLSLANWFTLRIGPTSWVQLTTTYVDERVRLGRGSFGSLFVFQRGEEADQAGLDKVGLETNVVKLPVPALLAGYVAILAGCVWAFMTTQQPLLQVLSVVTGLLATGIARVLWRGGNEDDDARLQSVPANEATAKAAAAAAAATSAAAGTVVGASAEANAVIADGGSKSNGNGTVSTPMPAAVPA